MSKSTLVTTAGVGGQPNGVPVLDGNSGLLVPAYAELAGIAAPAAPAVGKTRLYVDSNGLLQLLPAAGATRRVVTHWGSGTAFPTGIGPGDTYLRTDLGVLFSYQGGAVGLSGWIPESGPLAGGSGAVLARLERTTTAGPVTAETVVTFDTGSGTFTLTQQTRVQLILRGKNTTSANGNVARNSIYIVTGSTYPSAIPAAARLAALFDKYLAVAAYGESITFETDVLLQAGTYTMALTLSGPTGGAMSSLVYEPNAGGVGPMTSTVLKALAVGTS